MFSLLLFLFALVEPDHGYPVITEQCKEKIDIYHMTEDGWVIERVCKEIIDDPKEVIDGKILSV